jgi:hypothetical protein
MSYLSFTDYTTADLTDVLVYDVRRPSSRRVCVVLANIYLSPSLSRYFFYKAVLRELERIVWWGRSAGVW